MITTDTVKKIFQYYKTQIPNKFLMINFGTLKYLHLGFI